MSDLPVIATPVAAEVDHPAASVGREVSVEAARQWAIFLALRKKLSVEGGVEDIVAHALFAPLTDPKASVMDRHRAAKAIVEMYDRVGLPKRVGEEMSQGIRELLGWMASSPGEATDSE